MPRLEIEGFGTFDVASDRRLVKAIEGSGFDILHRCGGNARCTICRVEFIRGEPERMTIAEHTRLVARDLFGQVRLSCQILCDHDLAVRPVFRLSTSDLPDPGPEPADEITPPAEWMPKP